jgi:hypothetical protein
MPRNGAASGTTLLNRPLRGGADRVGRRPLPHQRRQAPATPDSTAPRPRSATDSAWRDDRAGSVDLTNAGEARERARERIAPIVISQTLSRDPPRAAASAHETHRVPLGSCKPVSAGPFALSRRTRKRPSAFSCLFARLAAGNQATKSADLQALLMARGGLEPPTPRFSVVRFCH